MPNIENLIAVIAYFTLCGLGVRAAFNSKSTLRKILAEKDASGNSGDTSFSRVAGVMGATMLSSFLIIFGGFIIYHLGEKGGADDIKDWFEAAKSYLIFSAALFTPYASNQISKIFTVVGGRNVTVDTRSTSIPAKSAPLYNPNHQPS